MFIGEFPPFRAPRWLRHPHLQTLAAFVAPGELPEYSARRDEVQLRDGDRIVVHDDRGEAWRTGDRIVVLVHGLCGCHGSPYMRRLADRLARRGGRVLRVDMRGFGDSSFLSRGHVHAGSSADLQDVVEWLHRREPGSRITVIGFSLGGNITLKALGEWGGSPPEWLDSAIAVSPPIDLETAAGNLRRGSNRMYDHYFMRQLRRQLRLRRQRVEGLVDNGLDPLPGRLLDFDDRFVAPVSGFRDASDYYRRSSSGPLLKEIRVPTLVVAARDDPLVPYRMYRQFSAGPCVEWVDTARGGHLGFLGRHAGDPDRFWLDWRLADWIASLPTG